MGRDGADVTCCGRQFQTRAAATAKARSLIVDSRVNSIDASFMQCGQYSAVPVIWESYLVSRVDCCNSMYVKQ